ncbi:MAG: hypothetical protein HYV63_21655 [Candidatus Schekmanbacteria bacterium]|nr:hypothetical protein [Candidatus Schekmanbacteria bacterium]
MYVYELVVSDNRFKTAEVRLTELLESMRRLAGDSLRPASALQVTEPRRRDCLDAVVNGWQRRGLVSGGRTGHTWRR